MDLPNDFHAACAAAFFDELFRLIPLAEPMFSSPATRESMFVTALLVIQKEADDPVALGTYLRQLGRRHMEMGISPVHFKIGGQAFLHAVQCAAPDISENDLAFFDEAYIQLTDAMLGRPAAE